MMPHLKLRVRIAPHVFGLPALPAQFGRARCLATKGAPNET